MEASAGGAQAPAVLQKEAQRADTARPLEEERVGGQSFDENPSHDDVIQEPLSSYHFLNPPVPSLKQAGVFTCGTATA